MAGFRVTITALLVVSLAAATAAATHASRADDGSRKIAMRDDCDPSDTNWNLVGGCQRKHGNVTFAEFNAELDSPLAAAVVGHQAWRNDPSYLVLQEGKDLRVTNAGGRPHTFTKVAAFGGGKIPNPALNEGLVTAPECPGSIDIAPGGSVRLNGLKAGNHRFICCLHPWMRALVKVKPGAEDDDD